MLSLCCCNNNTMEKNQLTVQEIASRLAESGLKVTPQRIAVMQALVKFHHHPTAEEIFREVSQTLPGLSATTVYNVLDAFVARGITHRIATDADVMRYDAVCEHHHHLYDAQSDRVEDYFDPELDELLRTYFEKKQVQGFIPHQIRLHLSGEFSQDKMKMH